MSPPGLAGPAGFHVLLLFLIFFIFIFSDFFQTNYRKICRAGLRQIFVVGRTHRGSTGNETCQWSVASPSEPFDWQVRYLDIYLFYVYGRTMAVDDQSGISFPIPQRTLPWHPICVGFIHRTDFSHGNG